MIIKTVNDHSVCYEQVFNAILKRKANYSIIDLDFCYLTINPRKGGPYMYWKQLYSDAIVIDLVSVRHDI